MSVINLELATFGEGCFWCYEAIFQELKGVENVTSGYAGGQTVNPTYEQVCTGNTGHAEVIQISFDPLIISYKALLQVFWGSHDPTTLNRQGNDVGTQYRSAIFYHSEQQKAEAIESMNKLQDSGAYAGKIVTLIEPLPVFYPAESYHNDYFNLHGAQPYCAMVVRPKIDKFKKAFADKLK